MMTHSYDLSAPKKSANLSINSDLLEKARRLKLNLSATLERALAEQVQHAERERWLEENRHAIDAANRLAAEHGLFSDSYQTL
jgi:antitoxin CcdA